MDLTTKITEMTIEQALIVIGIWVTIPFVLGIVILLFINILFNVMMAIEKLKKHRKTN